MRGDTRQMPLPLDGEAPAPRGPVVASASPRPTDSSDPIRFERRRRTRRYILRVLDDGSIAVTMPWRGSQREARRFVESQQAWIARQRAARMTGQRRWAVGADILVDGEPQRLLEDPARGVCLGADVVAPAGADVVAVRAGVHAHLRARAVRDLPAELRALAALHDLTVTRVSVRSQVSRWGSCSRRGGISLNWRLVQVPPFVRDYVLVHELMHRRELNHSARFWRLVAAACPRFLEARRWLRREGTTLFD